MYCTIVSAGVWTPSIQTITDNWWFVARTVEVRTENTWSNSDICTSKIRNVGFKWQTLPQYNHDDVWLGKTLGIKFYFQKKMEKFTWTCPNTRECSYTHWPIISTNKCKYTNKYNKLKHYISNQVLTKLKVALYFLYML